MRLEDLRNGLGSLHAVSGNGEVLNLSKMEVTNFYVLPFLNLLGYEVFNPEQIKLGYTSQGSNFDLAVFGKSGVINTLIVGETGSTEAVERHRGIGINLFTFTDGVKYSLYTFILGKVKKLGDFNLRSLGEEDLTFIIEMLGKHNLEKKLEVGGFDREVIKSNYGKLVESEHVLAVAVDLISNLELGFGELLKDRLIEQYMDGEDSVELHNWLMKELDGGVLLDLLGGDVDLSENEVVLPQSNSTKMVEKVDLTKEEIKVEGNINISEYSEESQQVKEEKVQSVESFQLGQVKPDKYSNPFGEVELGGEIELPYEDDFAEEVEVEEKVEKEEGKGKDLASLLGGL